MPPSDLAPPRPDLAPGEVLAPRPDLAPSLQGGRASGGRGPAASTSPIPRLALSPDEAAHALGVSRDFLDEHVGAELRWVRRGRRKLVAIAELERWLSASAARTLDPKEHT